MESYSSDYALKSVRVINNTDNKYNRQSTRLCGDSCTRISLTAREKAKKYFARLYKFKHMDFEYASWQMVNIFVSPQKLYRNFSYHNSTRNQWARDDPAFLILLVPWIFVSTVIFSAMLRHTFGGFLKLFMWTIFIETVLSGVVIATFFWIITNRWMVRRERNRSNFVEMRSRKFSAASSDDDSLMSEDSRRQSHTPDVEWAYAFDIHLNSIFPCIILLRILQTPLLFFIRKPYLWPCLLGNSIWLVSSVYYIYITFLGYRALPFLNNTRGILLSISFAIIFFIVSVVMEWNFSAVMYRFYRNF